MDSSRGGGLPVTGLLVPSPSAKHSVCLSGPAKSIPSPVKNILDAADSQSTWRVAGVPSPAHLSMFVTIPAQGDTVEGWTTHARMDLTGGAEKGFFFFYVRPMLIKVKILLTHFRDSHVF